MTAGKKQSDEELLFDVELLMIQEVAIWAEVSTKSTYHWMEAGKIGKRTYQNRLLEMQWTSTMLMQRSDGTAL